MGRWKRWTAIGVTAAVATLGLELVVPDAASATSVSLACSGVAGDQASSLGDSAATLGLLSKLSGGSGLTFPVEVSTNAPTRLTPNGGGADVTFDLSLTLPDTVVKPARDLLRLTSVEVVDAAFEVRATGAADATFTQAVPSMTVDLGANPVVVHQTISGRVEATSSGTINYVPGNTRMTINIKQAVAGINIDHLTVVCTSGQTIATTAVQVPGAPTVATPINLVAYTDAIVGLPLVGARILPDDDNPLVPDSLRVVGQAGAGFTAVGAGAAFYRAPSTPGYYVPSYEMCAASRTVPEVPGVDTTQTLTFPETYVGKDMNAHPVSMTLQFKGAKSSPIPLSFTEVFGNATPGNTDPDQLGLPEILGHFVAPSAATVQAALEAIPTIGAGNVAVTSVPGATTPSYTIAFRGALGLSDQPAVEVTDFNTWLPASLFTAATDLITPPTASPDQPTAPTTTVVAGTNEELFQKLLSGQITGDQFSAGFGANLKAALLSNLTNPATLTALTAMFPKPPVVAVTTTGKPTVAAHPTGPLCTQFNIGYLVIPRPAPVRVRGIHQTRVRRVCSTRRVKVKGHWVRKKVCRTVRR
ncbi:MAG: hypothetical protein R2698_03725 [Microthrixaceae bacterium]